MHRLVTIVAVLTLITFVAGCASTPASRFYTLSAASGPAAPSSNLSIAVGPVSVPAVVDRPQIVVNVGPIKCAWKSSTAGLRRCRTISRVWSPTISSRCWARRA